MTEVLELPFDQYQRYELVRALLESVRRPNETFRVLDVGGRTALLREFLPADLVDLVDVVPSDADRLVLGSGAELPFRDDAYDVVCGFDTLEHVPPPLRYSFVSECARVARRYAILAGPYHSPAVATAEETLLDFLKERLQWEHRYLAEHRENGLPSLEATQRAFEASGATVEIVGHGALDRWLLLMALELYVEHEALLHDFAKRVYRIYNEHVFRSDHGPEVYRHAVIAAFGGAPMPEGGGALDPAGTAPREATRALIDAGREVLRYDALRSTYAPEMERLHSVVAGVQKDLDGHRRSLTTVRSDLEEHRRTVSALESELASEREQGQRVVREKDEELERVVRARDDELQHIARAKDEEIDSAHSVIAELEELRAAEQRELELRAERLDHANRLLSDQNEQLVRVNEQMKVLSDQVGIIKEELVARQDELANREELVAQLRIELNAALADSAQVRERNAALADEANRFWARLGRALTFRRLDPQLTDRP